MNVVWKEYAHHEKYHVMIVDGAHVANILPYKLEINYLIERGMRGVTHTYDPALSIDELKALAFTLWRMGGHDG